MQLLGDARRARATQISKPDADKKIGLGYMIGSEPFGDSAFGHGGYGGAQGLTIPERRVAVGWTKNLFSPADATGDVLAALRRELDGL